MKKVLLMLSAIITMSLGAGAQVVSDEVDIETSDVKLEVITPAEPVKESKQEIKEREKKLRLLNDDAAFAKASNSLRRGYFVLLADYIQRGRAGYRHYDISSNSNFLLVQDEDAIFQYAINSGRSGANGLGGWTAKGKVRNKRISYAKNGDVLLQFQILGQYINSDVQLKLYHNNNYAEMRITGDIDMVMYGRILPYRDADHR